MEKIGQTSHVKNEVLQDFKEGEKNRTFSKTKKANWIGHILRMNCLLK